MTEIFIDEQRLDVYVDEVVALTKQISSAFDLKDRRTDFTNKFLIPRTAHNNNVMDKISMSGVSSRYQWSSHDVVIVQNGVEVVSNGIGLIESLGDKGYSISIQDGNISLVSAIEDKGLSDLDWSSLNHDLDAAEWALNINNEYTDGFVYPLADWGAYYDPSADTYHHYWDRQAPCVYVHWIWDKIMTEAGISYAGTHFADSDYLTHWISSAEGYVSDTLGIGIITLMNTESANVMDYIDGDAPNWLDSNNLFIEGDEYSDIDILAGGEPYISSNGVTFTILESGAYNFANTGDVTVVGLNPNPQLPDPDLGIWRNGTLLVTVQSGADVTIPLDVDDVVYFSSSIDWASQAIWDYTTLLEYYNAQVVSGLETAFTLDNDVTVKLDTAVIPINFSTIFSEISQKDFVKDYISYYGLIYQADADGVFQFKKIQSVYGSDTDFGDISPFISSIDKRVWTNGLPRRARFSYQYPDGELDEYADYVSYLPNENLADEEGKVVDRPYYAPKATVDGLVKADIWEFDSSNDTYPPNRVGYFFGKSVQGLDSFNYADTSDPTPIAFVGSHKIASFNGLSFLDVFSSTFSNWSFTMGSYEELELTLKMNLFEFTRFDFLKAYYIDRIGEYVVFDKVGAYKPNKLTKAYATIVRERSLTGYPKLTVDNDTITVDSDEVTADQTLNLQEI